MSSSTTTASKNAVLTTLFVALPLIYYYWKKEKSKLSSSSSSSSLSSIARRDSTLKPPFPTIIRDLLSACRLAYLSTVDTEESSSHLSLMRFTYLHDEEDGEIVILSTNKKTKKFTMLQKQRGVALLIHDFDKGSDGNYSITLNGTARILESGERKTEQYRKAHLKHNPDYPQFIVGDDISILCIDVTSARICNINDQVTKWDVGGNMASLS